MSSPEKKRRKKKTTAEKPKSTVLSYLSLPDELQLSCIARVSRLYYPSLSLVSKSFRTLLASPELYKTRSLLNHSESCLYVCLRFHPASNPRWFSLCRRPDRALTKKKKKPSRNILVPITSPHSTPVWTTVVAVDSDIYEIGGYINGGPSSNVSILDCRTNSWHKAPNMQVARERSFAIPIDGKIFVIGGMKIQDLNSDKCAEIFDPKTQTWEFVSSQWQSPGHTWTASQFSSHCVIDKVLYSYINGELKRLDDEARKWRIVKGLVGLHKSLFGRRTSCDFQLVDYGGKMVFLWDKHDRSSKCQGRMIHCAVIKLERCNSEEILGTVEWSDAVLKVPNSFEFVHVLAATV